MTPEEIKLLYSCEVRYLIPHLEHLEKLDGWRARKAVFEDIQKLDLGRTYPYLAVAVLLIQWEDHDLGSCDVVDELKDVFMNLFGFESIGTFKIPSHGSYEALERTCKSSDKSIRLSRICSSYITMVMVSLMRKIGCIGLPKGEFEGYFVHDLRLSSITAFFRVQQSTGMLCK